MKRQEVGKLRYVIYRDGTMGSRISSSPVSMGTVSLQTERATDPATDNMAISLAGRIISIVGSGGKTSTMYTLACELADRLKGREEVILTTTTKILPFKNSLPSGVRLVAVPTNDGKLGGIEEPDSLITDKGYIIIEADGSRGLPIKMPAEHEPVITDNTDTVIAVMGLKGIGRTIKEACHRPEIVCDFLKKNESDIVTVEDAVKIITSSKGLRKNTGSRSFALILNQADSEREITLGLKLAGLLPADIPCVLTAYEDID